MFDSEEYEKTIDGKAKQFLKYPSFKCVKSGLWTVQVRSPTYYFQ